MTEYVTFTPEERARIKDMSYGNSARLWEDLFEISYSEDGKERTQRIPWTKGRLVRFFSAADLEIPATNQIYVLNEAGEMFRIEILRGLKNRITPIPNPIPGLTRISRFGEKLFGLDTQGQLVMKSKGKRGFVPVPGFEKRCFSDLSRAFQGGGEQMSWTVLPDVTE